MEAEKIIIKKQYFELTSSELEIVSALVSDEVEYNDMKAFLLTTENVFKSQKITNTPELDDKILTHLNASFTTNRTWYNSFMLFLFPRDRRVYQYPAFQLALASVLIFGVFNLMNFDNLKGNEMAFEDVSEVNEEESTVIEKKVYLDDEVKNNEESELPGDVISNDEGKTVFLEETKLENTAYEYESIGDDQLSNNAIAAEETEAISFTDAEKVLEEDDMDEVVIDLKQEVNSESTKDLVEDVKEKNNAAMTYKEVEEEKEIADVVVSSPTTISATTVSSTDTDSKNDKALKLDRNTDKVSAKKEESANESDDYANGSVVQVANEKSKIKEQIMAREASINTTPELKQLFFEVK